MRVFFLLHEQYRDYTDEPAFTEVLKPFLASGYVGQHELYVYQRILRNHTHAYFDRKTSALSDQLSDEPVVVYGAGELTRKWYEKLRRKFTIAAIADKNQSLWSHDFYGTAIISPERIRDHSQHVIISTYASHHAIAEELKASYGDSITTHILYDITEIQKKIHPIVENEIIVAIDRFQPDLIVHTLTFAGENLRGELLEKIKASFPGVKIYTQWWDHADHIPELVALEKACLRHSDMVGIIDSLTRFRKIRYKRGIYRDYPNVDRLHWHPTVFDPEIYRKHNLPKLYDICILGSAEGERKKCIRFLSDEFGDRFNHFGGLNNPKKFVNRQRYAQILNQTRICVNTQTHTNRIQLKGRVREALSCGTFLLEEDNPETREFVDEGCGIIYFNGFEDLSMKIDFYLKHEAQRENIGKRGFEWYHRNHSAKKWVEYIVEKTGSHL